jgi:hypothetical protein
MPPAERAYQTKLDALCRSLVASLTELAGKPDATPPAVVALLSQTPRNTDTRRRLLADAFIMLDEKPHRFGNGQHCQAWHALLRGTRNHPTHGPAMFALWRGE